MTFFELLFDPEQMTCFAENPYGTTVKREPGAKDVFFSINALKDSRRDSNVVCYRTLLLELDKVPLDKQIDLVCSRVPVSAIVFIGNKSYHFYIALHTPLSGPAEYADVVSRLYKLIPEADPACKNPSRLSRIPGVIRPDTGRQQQLKILNTRIQNSALLAALPPSEHKAVAEFNPEKLDINIKRAIHYPDATMRDLKKARNSFFFWLGQRMKDANLPVDLRHNMVLTAYNNLDNTVDFSVKEALSAARVDR